MKLKYIQSHFVATGSYKEMVGQGLKDVPKKAGFRYSAEGESPFPAYALWWTKNKAKAKKLRKYATDKAKAALGSPKRKGSPTWKGALRSKRDKKEDEGDNWFNDLCRDMGIPVRVDFKTDEEYHTASEAERAL